MRRLVLATANLGKAEELRVMLQGSGLLGVEIRTLADYPGLPDVEETGSTFAENALLKARAAWRGTGLTALADDSGLEIDVLEGAPGVRSARFAGDECDNEANIRKVFSLLEDVPSERCSARFWCALAVVGLPERVAGMELPRGLDLQAGEHVVLGSIEGRIIRERRGTHGFGYDPIFYVSEYDLTMGQIEPHIKNGISHRARAFERVIPILRDYVLG